jgi:hypothetical protein
MIWVPAQDKMKNIYPIQIANNKQSTTPQQG